jgi:hypothetical protein
MALNWVRDQIGALPVDDLADVSTVLSLVNANQIIMSCCDIADFRPGMYMLDPRNIRKFGDEDEEFDYDDADPTDDSDQVAIRYPFVSIDSSALLLVDFAHLPKVVEVLTWEQYDLALQDDALFGRITNALGGPCFAVIMGGCMPGMEFDGDGVYTIRSDAFRPFRV